MADLSAVLRKTIDALPAATPQLRGKVYEKARAAVQRQIAQADPPLAAEMVEARQRALEEAIAATEAHYTGGTSAAPAVVASAGEARPAAPSTPAPSRAPVAPPPSVPRDTAPYAPPPVAPHVPAPYEDDRGAYAPSPPAETRAAAPSAAGPEPYRPVDEPTQRYRSEPAPVRPEPSGGQDGGEGRIGEIGPVSAPESRATVHDTRREDDVRAPTIPEADLTAPNYARARRRSGSRSPLLTGVVALLFIGGLGAAGYLYRDEISSALTGGEEVAATGTADEEAASAAAPGGEPAAATGEPAAGAEPVPADPSQRQFTQRLLPDGTEVDEGPVASVPNAFDEGTDIAAASAPTGEDAATPPPATAEAAPAAETPAGDPNAIAVGQRAVFYEERSADRPGAQLGGNVVWSVINEPPATGQPAEPAIRAVADIPETSMRMTMTIRRNADDTLPASHVIELLFNTPADFAGGEIENVQRLALKPTEQDRGEPLIGVAGRISDGFFIIALNDLDQAVENNLALMASQQWIDIPLAYSSGQRALLSLEKGIPGERVFEEALAAWAQRG